MDNPYCHLVLWFPLIAVLPLVNSRTVCVQSVRGDEPFCSESQIELPAEDRKAVWAVSVQPEAVEYRAGYC